MFLSRRVDNFLNYILDDSGEDPSREELINMMITRFNIPRNKAEYFVAQKIDEQEMSCNCSCCSE